MSRRVPSGSVTRKYAVRFADGIVPRLVSPDLEAQSGVAFHQKGQPGFSRGGWDWKGSFWRQRLPAPRREASQSGGCVSSCPDCLERTARTSALRPPREHRFGAVDARLAEQLLPRARQLKALQDRVVEPEFDDGPFTCSGCGGEVHPEEAWRARPAGLLPLWIHHAASHVDERL